MAVATKGQIVEADSGGKVKTFVQLNAIGWLIGARMLEQGHDLLYYENIEGGHGGAADNKQAAHMGALAYTFLWNELK